MGQYIRWQTILACCGLILLGGYLSSLVVTTTTVVVPAEGGTYREGLIDKPQALNSLLAAQDSVDQDVSALIFEGLVTDDGQGNIKPVLAKNWTISDDGKSYSFTLRDNVRWSNGIPFTSEDVVFTYNLIQSAEFPGNPAWQAFWQNINIEKLDAYTLRFDLPEPLSSFIYYTMIGILPRHLLQDVRPENLLTHPFNLSPVGTGPFRLLEATDRQILLAKNPHYWGPSPRIEQVAFKFYDTVETVQAAFLADEIDGMSQGGTAWLDLLKNQSTAQISSAPLARYQIIYLNHQRPELSPLFGQASLRQLLSMLLDRQLLVDQVLAGEAIPASGPILPWSWAYNPNQSYPESRAEEALKQLEAQGWVDSDGDGIRDKQGRPFAFTLLTSKTPTKIAVAQEVAAQWQKTGLQVRVQALEQDLVPRLRQKDFEAAMVEIQLLSDPDLYHLWHDTQIDQGQNFAGWHHLEASLALEQGRTATQRGQRIQPYYEFQRIFAEEMPSIILYYPVYTYIHKNTVENIQIPILVNPSGRFRNIHHWSLLTQQVIETKTKFSLIVN